MKKILKFALTVIALPLIYGCGAKQANWTDDEKANIQHFTNALEQRANATKIINSPTPESSVDRANQLTRIMELKKRSIEEAKLVDDILLDRIHPELRMNFRGKFQKSLQLFLDAAESSDNKKSIESSLLHDEWVDWINANNESIKIPK
tara:strand:- start:69 stop:515 length:447 start_codon:yes stop_codon:yes gene_type:complete